MIPGSSSRISRNAVISTVLAYLFLSLLAAPAPAQKGGSKTPQVIPTPSPEVPEQVDKVAEVQVKSALKVLQEGRSGVVYVLIRNISNVPITVARIVTTTDDQKTINANVTEFQPGQTVLPQQATIAKLDLSAAGQIREGAHLLLVQVDLQWTRNNKLLTGSLFASQEFNVEVLAVSGLLSVLGASSILFLPGFLAVTVFFVLNRLWGKYMQGEKWQLDLKSPEFWMAVLTLSLLAPYLYPLISGWYFGQKRDYRNGYGLSDVVLIWFGSIILSLVIWAIYRTVREFIVWFIETKRKSLANYGAALDLEPGDEPTELFNKLVQRWDWNTFSLSQKLKIIKNKGQRHAGGEDDQTPRGFSEGYPQYGVVTIKGVDEGYFLIEPVRGGDAAQTLIVPPVEYRYRELPDDALPDVRTAYEEFRRELDGEISQRSWNVRRIAQLFQVGANNWLDVNWGRLQSGHEKTPRLISNRQFTRQPDARIFLFRQR